MPLLLPLASFSSRKSRIRKLRNTALLFVAILVFTHWILDRDEEESGTRRSSISSSNTKSHRSLASFPLFSDPKTVVNKNYVAQHPAESNNNNDKEVRPLNIVAFGGSQTWGAKLQNRFDAYPWLIGQSFPDHVDNLATRATGADYPSVCLETMIPRNHAGGQPVYDLVSSVVVFIFL